MWDEVFIQYYIISRRGLKRQKGCAWLNEQILRKGIILKTVKHIFDGNFGCEETGSQKSPLYQ